jgi:hypothetical protein
MQKKFKMLLVVSSLAISGALLAACHVTKQDSSQSASNLPASSTDDKKVASIAITGPFQAVSYYQGATVDYSTLQINLLNGANKVLSTLKYSEHTDVITHTDIDTSAVATGLVFKVTYQPAGEAAISTTLTYNVLVNDMTPIQWHENPLWTNFNAANSAANATKDGRNSFIAQSKFYLGNKNSLNLFPQVSGKDKNGHTGTMDKIDSGVTVSVKDSTNADVSLDTLFSTSAKEALLKKGEIDFNDDVTGAYTLSFAYGNDATAFPTISYALNVVDGYNISDAKTLSIINNEPNGTSGWAFDVGGTDIKTRIDAWKKANNIPTDLTLNNAVIQNDIIITKADLPSYFVWGEEADHQPVSDSMKGTLRDWAWIYYRQLTTANPTFTLYGNFHKISLGSDFPYVMEDENARNGTAPATGTTINSHTCLFGGWNGDADRGAYHYNVQDLAFTGNTGVSDKEEDKVRGGVIFAKPTYDATITNCLVNTCFIGEVNGGYYDSATDYRDCTTEWINTRVHDTQSAQLFNWGAGTISAKDCEFMNAGGPIVINQPSTYDLSSMSSEEIANRKASNVILDDSCHLENYVTGQGGWFSFYKGASDYVNNLKQMDPLFNAVLSKTFLKKDTTDTSITRMNFIALNMTRSESTTPEEGSIYGKTSIGGKDVVNFEGGRSTMLSAIASASTDGGAAYQKALYSTDVGTTFMAQSSSTTSAPVFKMIGTAQDNFGMLTVDSTSGNVNGLVNAKYYATGASVDADKAFDADAKTANYLGVYAFGTGYQLAATNPANFLSWKGCNDYGLVFGFNDYKA